MTGPTVDRIVHSLYTLCALLILADLFYQKHPHFGFESLFGFYGFFGFLGSVGLVLLAKQLRRILMRDEDHYGDAEPLGRQPLDRQPLDREPRDKTGKRSGP